MGDRPGSARTLADLTELLEGCVLASPVGAAGLRLHGVTHDSRSVRPGMLYAGLPGASRHGADFAEQARRRGAVAMLSDRADPALPTLVVDDPRAVLGTVADRMYGRPSRDLRVIAVTGTNGKTSTAHLLDAGLAAAGRPSGLLSTVTTRTGELSRPSVRTTPEAPELQAWLADVRDSGATHAVLEASSHGLDLHRLDGTAISTAIFTNLTRDHLDHHGDMERYFAAKASLFEPARCSRAVVSLDDEWGRRLAGTVRVPLTTVSAGEDPSADWQARDIAADAGGTSFRLVGPGVDRSVRLALLGVHQVDNALGAIAALVAEGIDVQSAVAGMERLDRIPGRLEQVDVGQPFEAYVDYAHNPGAQARIFEHLAGRAGRLLLVLGAAGNRDLGKRRLLAESAAAAADLVVITDESPYAEDPAVIRDALRAAALAVPEHGRVLVEPDRRQAIRRAVEAARPGDVVFVGGRGHEQRLYRTGEASVPFDDREVLADCLRRVVTPLPIAA